MAKTVSMVLPSLYGEWAALIQRQREDISADVTAGHLTEAERLRLGVVLAEIEMHIAVIVLTAVRREREES